MQCYIHSSIIGIIRSVWIMHLLHMFVSWCIIVYPLFAPIMHEVIWLIFAWTTVSPWLTLIHLRAGYCYCPPSPSSNPISQRLCVAPDYITTPCQCLSDVCEVRIFTNMQHCIRCLYYTQPIRLHKGSLWIRCRVQKQTCRRFTIRNTSVADKLVYAHANSLPDYYYKHLLYFL